jgi:hypothetical protein
MFAIDAVIAKVIGIVDKFVPDTNKKAEMVHEITMSKLNGELKEMDNEYQLLLAQIETNKIEAASPNVFVAGWRPAVGWTCVLSLAYVAVFEPILEFAVIVGFGYAGKFPTLPTEVTMQVLFAILGVAGLRTIEKVKGVTK